MKLLLDYVSIVKGLGGTPSWSFASTGGAAEDSSYPAANLFDSTTTRNGYALNRYARATFTANAETVTYTIAFGATYDNVRTMIVSGFVDESSNVLGLQADFGGVGAAALSGVSGLTFQDSAGASKKTLGAAAGAYWSNVTTPQVVLRASSAFNDTGVKFKITASAAGATRIGYIGVYGDVGTIDPTAVSVSVESQSSTGIAESGAPWAAVRSEARTVAVPFAALDQSARELVDQLTRHRVTGGLGLLDPRAYPVLALYFDELDVGTTEGEIATNLQSGMYILDDSVQYQFTPGASKLRPNAVLTFRQWR